MSPSQNIRTGIPGRTPLRLVRGAPPDPLRITVRYVSETTVVELAGELDLATAQILDARLAALGEYRLPRLVIDVTALTFCDCSGLGALVRVRNQAVAEGGWLRLCGVAGLLAKMIRIARIGVDPALLPRRRRRPRGELPAESPSPAAGRRESGVNR